MMLVRRSWAPLGGEGGGELRKCAVRECDAVQNCSINLYLGSETGRVTVLRYPLRTASSNAWEWQPYLAGFTPQHPWAPNGHAASIRAPAAIEVSNSAQTQFDEGLIVTSRLSVHWK